MRQPGKPRAAEGRIKLSSEEWRKLKREIWEARPAGEMRCALCQGIIRCYEDFQLDHILPRGMGGSKRDDRAENLQLVHAVCNFKKGSQRKYPR